MDWRKLLERLGALVVFTVFGTLAGGFIGTLYFNLSSTASGWDGLALVLGGLLVGCLTGFVVGIIVAFFLKDEVRRRATLVTLVIDVVVFLIFAITDFIT